MNGSVADRLRARIALEGPLTVADFMSEVLHGPGRGYYMRQDPFGAAGDFVTAPEISQVFGELVGLWCAQRWTDMGAPSPVSLVELGPGRGTLLADAWRAMAVAPAFRAAVRVHLVEISPVLREVQRRRLAESGLPDPEWHAGLDTVPEGPLLLIANEFFDALPVHQFVRDRGVWRERRVRAGDEGFAFVLDRHASPRARLIPKELSGTAPEGSVAEVSPAAISAASEIGRRMAAHPGSALIVDYGPQESELADTLQAVRGHRRHDVLREPGTADLTAHVDFATLARAAAEAGGRVFGPVAQGEFLRRLGIDARVAALVRRATAAQAAAVSEGVRRLIAPDQMGTLFKLLAITSADLPLPVGFELAEERLIRS